MATDHEMRMEALKLFEENERLKIALQKISDLVDSEIGEPLDEAIAIANRALRR